MSTIFHCFPERNHVVLIVPPCIYTCMCKHWIIGICLSVASVFLILSILWISILNGIRDFNVFQKLSKYFSFAHHINSKPSFGIRLRNYIIGQLKTIIAFVALLSSYSVSIYLNLFVKQAKFTDIHFISLIIVSYYEDIR